MHNSTQTFMLNHIFPNLSVSDEALNNTPSYQMRTLISHHLIPNFLFNFPSISSTNKKPIFILHSKCHLNPQNTIFNTLRASCTSTSAASYNGWDDHRLLVDSHELGESNYLKRLLISLGINDKKYIFTCILGFVCALAISRVRVSSIIVFPAAAIVFAVGFSLGFSRGGPHKGGLNKSRVKDESFRIYADKLKGILEIFDGFDVKVSDLRNDLKNAIESERVEFGDLESYVNEVEEIGGLVSNAKNLVEDCIDGILVEVEKNPNQTNRKKKGTGNKRFNLFEFVGSFVGYNAAGSKSSKTNFVRKDNLAKDVVERDWEVSRAAEGSRKNEIESNERETKRVLRQGTMNTMEEYMNTRNNLDADEYAYQNIRIRSDRRFRSNMSAHREVREWASDDSMNSEMQFDIFEEHLGDEENLKNQDVFRNSMGAYKSSRRRENVGFGNFEARIRQERMNVEDEHHSRKYQSRFGDDIGSFSSSAVSDDLLFDKCLRKAKDLLKEAKEFLKAGNDDIIVEEMLQEASKLLCQAIALKPMSLLAIGQLGNTYLLHGELKLKISRDLRSLLSRRNDFGAKRSNLFILEDAFPNEDGMENHLISACEECEALLIEAGRKYRMALSIDSNDVRALYNWGLALSFRAQLIADVGPEAALDADKLYLAAIDKFNAMMSKSNDYAPEALFRWGMALQQRSRLRPNNSKNKVKLLQQAKRLYEDAVNMGSNDLQVRKALTSCMSELNFTDI